MAKPTCPKMNLLQQFLAGGLSAEDTNSIRSHLAECASCSETLNGLSGRTTTIRPNADATNPTCGAVDSGPSQDSVRASLLDEAPDVDSMPPPVDIVEPASPMVGPYRIEGLLGRGGMGNVYRATHVNLGKVVAIKILPPDQFFSSALLDRFQREMKAVGRLDHPNLVRATDAGMACGVYYLAMEFVQGVDLSQLVRRRGRLPVPEVCELIRQAAIGLHHAHEHGLIHRDVKPSNLMLAADGTVKVLDVGLALLADDPGKDVTSEGVVMGTLDYMAPEQASDSHSVDARADVYSIGCTLYQLLCGRAPFSGPEHATPIKRLMAHAQSPPRSVCEFRTDIPQELQRLIERMLSKTPADRPQTAAEVVQGLAPFAQGADVAALLSTGFSDEETDNGRTLNNVSARGTASVSLHPTRSEHSPAVKSSRPSKWLIKAALITSLLMVAGVIVIIRNRQGEETARFRVPKGGSAMFVPEPADGDAARLPSPTESAPLPQRRGTRPPAAKPPDLALANLGTWEAGTAESVLWGLVPHPAKFPGIKRWNVDTVIPRSAVWSMAYAPDARLLAYGTGAQVHVIDAKTKATTNLFDLGPTFGHGRVYWSPNHRFLASATNGSTVYQLWNVEENRPGPPLQHELGWRTGVSSASFSPDSRYLVGGQGEDMAIWSTETGGLIARVEGPARLNAVAWSPDGRHIASGGRDNVIRIWDAQKRVQVHVFSGHNQPINAVAWHPEGDRLASCSNDGQIRIWSLERPMEEGAILPKNFEETSIADLDWSPDGKHLAAHVVGRGVAIWEVAGSLLQTILIKDEMLRGIGWTRDAQHVVTCTDRGVLHWRLSDGRLEQQIGAFEPTQSVKWSPDGRWIAVGRGPTVVVLTFSGRSAAVCRGHDGPIHDLAWSPDSSLIASASGDHTVRVWDISTGRELRRLSGHTAPVGAVAWNPKSELLATGSEDQTIRLWNPKDGEALRVMRARSVTDLAWSPDGRRLASAESRRAQVWNVADPQPPLKLGNASSRYFAVAWSPSGDQIVASLAEGPKARIQSWSAQTGEPGGLDAKGGAIGSRRLLAWNPVSPWIVCNVGYSAELIDSRTGTKGIEVFNEQQHHFVLNDADWSPDGRYLVGVGSDNTIRVWDTVNNASIWRAVLLPSGETASFTPAGEFLDEDALAKIDEDLIYYVELDDGRIELLSPTEFRNRIAGNE